MRRYALRTAALLAALAIPTLNACEPGSTTKAPEDEIPEGELPEGAMDGPDAVDEAGTLVETGRAADGLAKADEALKEDPDNAELHFVRGMALQALGKGEEAIAAWETALAKNPKLFGALDGIASAYLDLDELDKAIEYADKAIALKPSFSGAHFNKGIALIRKGDAEGAIKSFQTVVELDPKDVDAMIELAAAQESAGRKDEARATVNKAFEVNPDDAYVRMVRADLMAVDGAKPEELAVEYAKVLELDPGLHPARLRLVRALRKLGKAEEALEHSDTLVRAQPQSAILWSDHGGVLDDLERYDEALEAYAKALELQPKLVSAHRRKVRSLAGANKCKQAKAAAKAMTDAGIDAAQVKLAQADAKKCK